VASRTSTSRTPDAGALARQHTAAAIAALVQALSKPSERVAAARALLDHGYGQALQHIALYAPKVVVECRATAPTTQRANGKDAEERRPARTAARQTG
jgi:hypothetical protein